MPCWYYEKEELKNTPTRKDEIDYETECRYREEGARFIMTAGTKMKLGYNTIATGVVYFHRFYMFHSFRNFPRYVTACSCLFLAGKVEETPKKCKDIIEVARSELDDFQFQQFGENPKEEVMVLEKILLQTMKFDLQVDHPYQFLLKYAKCIKGDKKKLNGIVQMAWTFVNDSLRMTTLCLQWEPEVIAVALMYLAGKLGKFKVVDWFGRTEKHLFWWDMFVEGVTMKLLEDICHQVLDVYTKDQRNPAPAPATDLSPLSKINAYKKSKMLPIPTVASPNTSQITPPPPVGKPITPFIGTVEVPGPDEALLLANENSSDSHYPYPPLYSNPPPRLPMFPASFPAHPGSSGHPGPPVPVPPGPGVIPPMPPTSYPTSFSYPPPPFLYPPAGNTPPLKF